jgi:D-glycero-D-manno-heptose 1,7-bisphosphate phosphatase
MKRKAVFFDRDNTLIACDGYLGEPEQVELIDGAADAIARLRSLGFLTVVFSNQSGVARGLFDEAAVQAVNARMDEMLRFQNPGAILDRHEYCPYHPEAVIEKYRQESELRKPRAGMIYRAHHALDLNLGSSWVIGDAPRDIEAGRTAGCRTILFQDPALPRSEAAEAKSNVRPDYTVVSLNQAVDIIEQSLRPATPPRPIIAQPNGDGKNGSRPPTDDEEPDAVPQAFAQNVADAPVPAPIASVPPAAGPPLAESNARLESLSTQILLELKRRNEREHTDFSISKLLAGIVQVIVLALLFVAYLNYEKASSLQPLLLLTLTLQTMVVALLLMSRRA